MIGKRFGKLTVIEEAGRSSTRYVMWKCRCDCGREKIVSGHNLRSGNTTSCGCVRKERVKMLNFVTGQYKSRIHRIWDSMKSRCYNKKLRCYKDYGGRGIIVCEEWKDNFKAFYEWSIQNGYSDNLSIDRIDVNGNYEPSNCRWVTKSVQSRNMRRNRLITYNGETKCIAEWASIFNLKPSVLGGRLRIGWSVERALNTSVKGR